MKTKLLKKLRREANANLDFYPINRWIGWWETKIGGQEYTSRIVSTFSYCFDKPDKFIREFIIEHCEFLRKQKRV